MDRRVQKTKSAIREAYMELVAEKKGKKITVSDIAKVANIDRKTFYTHYEEVDDILRDFWGERVQELLSKLQKTEYFREPINLLIIYDELNQIIWRDMDFYRQLATNAAYEYFWTQIHEIVVDALVAAYGDRVNMRERELKMYCHFFVSGIIRLYQDYLKNPNPEEAHLMGQVITDALQRGAMKLTDSSRSDRKV